MCEVEINKKKSKERVKPPLPSFLIHIQIYKLEKKIIYI